MDEKEREEIERLHLENLRMLSENEEGLKTILDQMKGEMGTEKDIDVEGVLCHDYTLLLCGCQDSISAPLSGIDGSIDEDVIMTDIRNYMEEMLYGSG